MLKHHLHPGRPTAGRATRRALTALALLGAAALTLTGCVSDNASGAGSSSTASSDASGTTIKIGAYAFPEGQLLANTWALALQHAGFKTQLIQMAGREVGLPALSKGDIDLSVEYTSSTLDYYQASTSTTDVSQNVKLLRGIAAKKNATILDPAPATDNYAFGVATKFAKKNGLKSLADLAKYSQSNPITMGGIQQCEDRSYCYAGLKSQYGINFKGFTVTVLASQNSVDQLLNDQIQLLQFDSSDGVLADNPVTILSDPKGLNHPDHIIPEVYTPVASAKLEKALNSVNSKLTQELLNSANKSVQVDRKPVTEVAQELYKKLS
jgi:osmoprotectant transport system substrate-binding protein